ncbi:PepSY-associated TM helix domain-containing protein [Paludisphaera mucosa]|uniref:PepSY domain-containing protein n=1 Tax=Paludisphaera mucosa TaxID=3030827 RepID=A0ABT6FBV2_9BACT|nr:PepSY domain-containing protein [Paludisphaera mucosa]MDG3004855.1 PepSY domain-containing protein [Paludisphaera mucosa]
MRRAEPADGPDATLLDAKGPRKPGLAAARRPASASLHRVVWRWHFYAGLFVAPILFVVAATGAAYVFRAEIEDYAHARLRFVAPGDSRLGARAIVDAAQSAHPGMKPSALELPADADRAAIVRFGKGPVAYVDPYRGRVLGSTDPAQVDGLAAFFDVVLSIHRQLFLGSVGRLVVELSVGWTIVLLATGLYLWWPRKLGQAAGVWRPRWRAKPYTILRDLHAVGGVYMLAPALVIVVTGLFYTLVWSEAFHLLTRDRGRRPVAETAATPPSDPSRPALTLDQIEVLARARYPGRSLAFTLGGEADRGWEVQAANDYNKSYGPYVSARFRLDRLDGGLLSHATLAEDERYWWHGWAYPLHVGSVLGPATKVLWFLTCLVLCALPATGVWMWLKRRPRGGSGFPRRPERDVPRGLLVAIVVMAIALPVVGLSMVLIVLGERLVGLARAA